MTDRYRIVRLYADRESCPKRTLATGLSLEEAKAHCRDPETSSRTCTKYPGRRRTQLHGAWFDGYEKEN